MKSFRQTVLDAVIGGASSIDQVLAAVGHTITASRAALAGRREAKGARQRKGRPHKTTTHKSVAAGRRMLVSTCLYRLTKAGCIRRVGKGAYAPPLPKIHTPKAG